tara:strand:- start:6141 stop:8054 length:1914 start_codon:yes stop_codon:yes gene_type:complete
MISKTAFQVPGRTEQSRYEKIHNKVFNTAEIASKAVANEIAELIKNSEKDKFILGLATGSSPISLYKELVRLHKEESLSFKNVITFNLDEYYNIKKENSQSYYSFMNHHLFDHIDIDKKNIFIPNGEIDEKDVEKFCSDYEKKIQSFGGIDFQVLGIGRTSHIGFNEPGSHENSATRLISLDPITREDAASDFSGLNLVPTKAITMGISTIMQAKRIVLLAWGHKKAKVIQHSVEQEIESNYPATFLQNHKNCTFVIDVEASAELTKYKTPWLVKECDWTNSLKKKAITWLSRKVSKSILKLTTRDYNEMGLSSLLAISKGSAYDLNIWMFNQLQHTITGWPGGKPNSDDSKRPERAKPSKKRVLIFSPHPDDDVISMGGTFARLIEQNHEVHVAYQTSGNIAVSNDEVKKYIEVSESFITDKETLEELSSLKNNLSKLTSKRLKKASLDIKSAIRKSECLAAGRFLELPENHLHFMNSPFYETGEIVKNEPSEVDIKNTINIIKEIKPHQIFAAGDLADPHGTHRICLDIIFDSLKVIKDESFMKDCWLWLYRGAWQEWNIEDIEMAVPLSPGQVLQKRNAILFHQSQKDKVMFQGEDNREFWLRAEERNQKTAKSFNKLGFAEYQAIEAFKRHHY